MYSFMLCTWLISELLWNKQKEFSDSVSRGQTFYWTFFSIDVPMKLFYQCEGLKGGGRKSLGPSILEIFWAIVGGGDCCF